MLNAQGPNSADVSYDVPVAPEDEETRLRLDEEARQRMREQSESAIDLSSLEDIPSSSTGASTRSAGEEPSTVGSPPPGRPSSGWKWEIRKRIWDMLEDTNLARNPRPVHHRIPNFVGAEDAAEKLAALPEFKGARCVKVNPDTPQKKVRLLTLTSEKLLLTPQPRLRSGFFSLVDPGVIGPGRFLECSTSAGVAKHGVPLGLRGLDYKVDMVVVGSVAVDPLSGGRIGKGEGFAELEYGILRWMGVIDDDTPIVTTVRDEQLVPGEIGPERLMQHDLPVSIICTPSQVIRVQSTAPKPSGIYWDLLSPQKLAQIPVLQQLKRLIEAETGEKLPLGPDETLPPTAARGRGPGRGRGGGRDRTILRKR